MGTALLGRPSWPTNGLLLQQLCSLVKTVRQNRGSDIGNLSRSQAFKLLASDSGEGMEEHLGAQRVSDRNAMRVTSDPDNRVRDARSTTSQSPSRPVASYLIFLPSTHYGAPTPQERLNGSTALNTRTPRPPHTLSVRGWSLV